MLTYRRSTSPPMSMLRKSVCVSSFHVKSVFCPSFSRLHGISTSLLLYPSHLTVYSYLFTLIFSLFSMCSFLLFHYSSLFIVSIMPAEEVQKLQKHLALLRQEYVKMQQKLVETDRRCSVLAAQASLPGSVSQASDSFISRLLAIVADLFQQEQYR